MNGGKNGRMQPNSKEKQRSQVILSSEITSVNLVMEKAMATHSSTLAWKIPWTEEPGRLQSMGLLRVGHD